MFYTQFLKICKEHNVKPTPLIKSLGFSTGNLKKWSEGATVNSDILAKLAEYFNVPVDYFFEDDEPADKMVITDDGNSIKKVYNVLAAHPDHIASMYSGTTISSADLNRIAAYMNCSVEYLVPADLSVEGADDGKTSSVIPDKDCILNILEKLAGNAAYRYLQVRISSIIISNLAKKNITMDKLIDINLSEKKIRDLYDLAMPSEKKKGLNFSDLMRISEAFNVSYNFMLTGNGE